MQRKYRFLWALILLAAMAFSGCAATEDVPEVAVDGVVLDFSIDPVLEDSVLMVPGQEIFRALYGEPIWDLETKTLGIQDSALLFLFQAGNKVANINDTAHELSVAPVMKGEQLLIPLELVVEVLGARLEWKSKSSAAIWTEDSQLPPSDSRRFLIGLWSTTSYYGEMFDANTGLPVDSAYSGEWYLFREDGTFRYIITGSGFAISGTVVQEGKYRVEGQELVLSDIKASWYPDLSHPNQSPGYENKPSDDERISLIITNALEIQVDGDSFFFHQGN